MQVPMRCCHLKHKGEAWVLDLGAEGAEVRDASGDVRAQFTREEAAESFLLPSFSESIKQFRVPVDGELWYFDVAKNDLKEIKAYINQAVVAAGPEAVVAVRNRAIRDGLIGLGGVAAGVALTLGSFFNAAQNPVGGRIRRDLRPGPRRADHDRQRHLRVRAVRPAEEDVAGPSGRSLTGDKASHVASSSTRTRELPR